MWVRPNADMPPKASSLESGVKFPHIAFACCNFLCVGVAGCPINFSCAVAFIKIAKTLRAAAAAQWHETRQVPCLWHHKFACLFSRNCLPETLQSGLSTWDPYPFLEDITMHLTKHVPSRETRIYLYIYIGSINYIIVFIINSKKLYNI